jgi:hypothetical protein
MPHLLTGRQDLHRHCRSKCHTFRRFRPARIVERPCLGYTLDKAQNYLAWDTHSTRHKKTLPWVFTQQGKERPCLKYVHTRQDTEGHCFKYSLNKVMVMKDLASGTHSTRHGKILPQVHTLNKLGTKRSSLGYPLDKAPKIYLGCTR